MKTKLVFTKPEKELNILNNVNLRVNNYALRYLTYKKNISWGFYIHLGDFVFCTKMKLRRSKIFGAFKFGKTLKNYRDSLFDEFYLVKYLSKKFL